MSEIKECILIALACFKLGFDFCSWISYIPRKGDSDIPVRLTILVIVDALLVVVLFLSQSK